MDQSAVTLAVAASMRAIWLVSSIFTNTVPLPSARGNSGFPGNAIVSTTLLVCVSITVAFLLRPLKAKILSVFGSNKMPSGLVPVSIV